LELEEVEIVPNKNWSRRHLRSWLQRLPCHVTKMFLTK